MCWTGLQNALSVIVVKKPSFTGQYFSHGTHHGKAQAGQHAKQNAALPIGGIPALILGDLNNLNASSIAFADSFIAVAPVSFNLPIYQ